VSWHFSQALVEDFSQASCSDGARFAPLRSTTTREAYCWRDRTTECLDLFQYGMTLDPSTADLGAELLMWCLAAFRARTSASPAPCGAATASTETHQGFGASTCESSTSANLRSCSQKTAQSCDDKGSAASFDHLPPAGLFQGGRLSEHPMSDCGTKENVCGSLLPTPTARDWKDTFGMTPERKDGKTRLDRLPMLIFDCARSAGIDFTRPIRGHAQTVLVKGLTVIVTGKEYAPELSEWLMAWPIGWTDCAPLEMDRFLEWQRAHGDC
jgi:hypothetical protein